MAYFIVEIYIYSFSELFSSEMKVLPPNAKENCLPKPPVPGMRSPPLSCWPDLRDSQNTVYSSALGYPLPGLEVRSLLLKIRCTSEVKPTGPG